MKKEKIIFTVLHGLGVLLLGFYIFLSIRKTGMSGGPYLTAFFVLFALGFQTREKLKSFSYTFWIFAAVTASMYYPQLFTQVGDFELKKLIVPLLQIIMFGMGSQLSIRDFSGVIKMPQGVVAGLICQFSIMPLVGFALAGLFGFSPEIAAGIILVGSSPSGLASNVMSFIAKANLALSVTLTAFATILAPFVTPALMKLLAGQYIPIDFWSMMLGIMDIVILPIIAGLVFNAIAYSATGLRSIIVQVIAYLFIIALKNYIYMATTSVLLGMAVGLFLQNLLWFIILPVVAGFIFKYLARGSEDWLNKTMALVSMVGIAVIIAIITAAGRDDLLKIGLLLILACFLHNVIGYVLGYRIARLLGLDEQSSRTIGLEVGMQNAGLASGIALQIGKVATVGLAPAVFGPMMNITGSSLANWWRNKNTTIDQPTSKI
jgi:BASS family bile acid:Na+ symporter